MRQKPHTGHFSKGVREKKIKTKNGQGLIIHVFAQTLTTDLYNF